MSDEHRGHEQPTVGTYVRVALVLTVVTALEVGVIYVRRLAPVVVPLLLAMSAAKFRQQPRVAEMPMSKAKVLPDQNSSHPSLPRQNLEDKILRGSLRELGIEVQDDCGVQSG